MTMFVVVLLGMSRTSDPASVSIVIHTDKIETTMSEAMNGAGIEELNHEIYGTLYNYLFSSLNALLCCVW